MKPASGKVYLVGGGPGDPGLITLRGCQCLARADVVLYDYLINPRILEHTRSGAELICLGRHGRGSIWPQHEINAQLVRHAQAGRKVVRLKGGDPAIFARTAEETTALVSAGVPYEIVPGITAALAAASYAGIPLTQGEHASAVAFVTGQERADKPGPGLDYQALAAFPGTLVFYMGVTTVGQWSTALEQAGKPVSTPVAIVRRVAWPDQEIVSCTLGTVEQEVKSRRLRPPVLFVIGPVATQANRHNWFLERPLSRRRVLVTRAVHQAGAFATALEELGAEVLFQPAIEVTPPDDWQAVDRALANLDRYDWLVFASANGVRALLDRLLATHDVRALGQIKLAAIGPGSAEELVRYHLRADIVPDEFRAESLAAALTAEAAGKRFLLARASRGREVLADELAGAGGVVEQIVVYNSRDVTKSDPQVANLLTAGKIDWVTVTSSAIARSLANLYGDALGKARLASISPITSATLIETGHPPEVEAAEYTMNGLLQAILAAEAG